MEAALALGMSRRLALRRVIVPQAVRIVIPPVTNDFIALFKDTSVCSVVTLVELTKQYSILAFQAGSVTVDGLRLQATVGAPDAMRSRTVRQVCVRVGMVFQSFNLFPHRTVVENVMEGPVWVLGRPVDESRERACRLLNRVGMGSRLDALPHQLSGGQQQRVAIARALAMEPQVMLFDEPTSALDPRMTGEVLAVMTDLAGDGLTMVVVTHAMHFARRVAHSVHVFGEGRIIESGTPDQIFDQPAHEATRTLLSEVLAA
jgi:polar amino acid transport system ATP-binding protein